MTININMEYILETMVDVFTKAEDLMEFAVKWDIQESHIVQFRLFQINNPQYDNEFINEQLDTILATIGGPFENPYEEDMALTQNYVRERQEIEGAIQAILFDDEMEATAKACLEDGDWDPPLSPVQIGCGEEPQPGPSRDKNKLDYTIEKKSERTYKKNAAVDTTYTVKIDEQYNGQQLQDIQEGLNELFNHVLEEARGDLAGNDLGRVVLHHDGLQEPIVVPLQRWDELNAEKVMETIQKVLNSNQTLSIDHSFSITVGTVDLPKGGKRKRINRIRGDKNSLDLKRSIVTIQNDDNLCMARAISVSWAKLKRCTLDEWKEITRQRQGKSNLQLVLEHQKVTETYFKKLRNKGSKEQGELAETICQLAGVSTDRAAGLQDIEAFEDLLGIRVMVVSARLGNKFITSPSTDERPCIYIYLIDNNHFHAITSITGFFSAIYFCHKCLYHYSSKEKHQCDTSCLVCKRGDCLTTDQTMVCVDCNMDCRSQECYDNHKEVPIHQKGQKKGQPRGPSQCQKWWKCPTCYKVVRLDKREKEEHECGEYWCSSCKKYVMNDHQCFLRANECKEDFIPKFIFFDFECRQDVVSTCQDGYQPRAKSACINCQPNQVCTSCAKCQNCNTSWCGKATHLPNFVVAHTVCPMCIDTEITSKSVCKCCGSRCEECAKTVDDYDNEDDGPCPGTCGFREVVFQGQDTSEKFGQWLFSEQHEYFKVVAHNMKGYDGYFLLEYLIDQSMRPDKIIYNGSKIMYMTVERDLHIKVIDSLNFLPMKLSQLPKAFGLTELKKGWFPHFFNTKNHQDYTGPYPEPKYYGHDFMSVKEKSELLQWLDERKNDTFDFRKEMLEYCRSDVNILRQACLKFRKLLMNATGEEVDTINDKGEKTKIWVGAVDPFDSVTIASVCMNVFRTKYLAEQWRVKLEDTEEWIPAKQQDGTLYVWDQEIWISQERLGKPIKEREFIRSSIAKIPPTGYQDQYSKVSIQWLEWMAHLNNVHIQHALNTGEKHIPGTRYKLDGYCQETNTAFEFSGCLVHGCLECYPDKREERAHPLTKQSMQELYALTLKKKAYIEGLGMKYVCIWEHDYRRQLNNNPDMKRFVQQLDLTERLDPRDSFFGGRTNAAQLYYKTADHERIKYVDFTSLYPWVNKYCRYPVGHPTILTKDFKDIKEYFGIAKIKILPPRGLYHPVLPYRSNGKLKFPLCRTCADTENLDPCFCSDDSRVLTGTWCIPEIESALRVGYTLTNIYEVYHWEESTQYDPETREGGLFAQYINTFLKYKQEASGLPDWVKTESDIERYIEEYGKKEGVSLNRENIIKNPGLRALAKLCLNSFWGKFGQRLNMRQTQIYHESQANEFFQVFTDPTKQPMNFHILSDDMIQLEWTFKTECQPEDNKTNVYLATFTTCWARLKLYSLLEQLDRRVLYYDTDSVIYVSRPGEADPPLGDYLGELTNELAKGEHIVEFVSGGPKNYAYKTNTGKETCKVRGFTLNYANSQLINFESVKQIVTNPRSNPCITITNTNKICRDKRKRKLYNKQEHKSYQMVYTKRRRIENYDTVPYGY